MKIGHGTRPQAPPPETGGRRHRIRDIARRATTYVMTGVLSLSTLLGSISPIVSAYADDVALLSTANPGDGWYYLIANGSDAKNGYILNLEGCKPGSGVNSFITNQQASMDESGLAMLENMWYIQHVDGDWFTIRNAHGYAISANEDKNDNLQTAGYNSGDAAQKWHLEGGRLVAQNGDEMRLANGQTSGSPICDQNNGKSSTVTWNFEEVKPNSTLTVSNTSPLPGTEINVSNFNPNAHIGYNATDNPTMDANRAAGASVTFDIKNGSGETKGLPYTVTDADVNKEMTVTAHVKSAFGVEIWSTSTKINAKEDTRPGPGEGAGSIEVGDQWAQVDDSYFFNSGNYMNMLDHWQDPPFSLSDFKTSGGHVVALSRSHNKDTDGWNGDVYSECQIWPSLINKDTGVEGWAFITDDTWDAAEGAWVEMTYSEAGYIRSAENTDSNDKGTLVDIKVRYTIMDSASATHLQNYRDQGYKTFDGHLAIHFTDNFSYGTFQFGVMNMAATYEFFDHATGKPLDIDSIYYTKTSMDKGETLAVEPDQVVPTSDDPGVFLSSEAPVCRGNGDIPVEYQYDVIPGTRIYNGAHYGAFDGMLSFAGSPWTPTQNGYTDYWDKIGDSTYYWRSTCMRLNMDEGSQLTVYHGAVGWDNPTGPGGWTDEFDIPDPDAWDNGGLMYTTHNFLPPTNVIPDEPIKYINGGTDLVTGVKIGDTVHYDVEQTVIDLGSDGLSKYHTFSYIDELPQYVKYVDGSGKVIDPYGNPVSGDAGSISYDEGTNTLTYTFTEDFLENSMIYEGGTYTFSFDVEVVDQPSDDLLTVENDCNVEINGYVSTSNIVEYEPVKPVLDIEKHAVLDYNLASAINEYEYLNHDENPEKFSTVHYTGFMQNITDGTRAKNVTIYDQLPPGLSLVPGSVKVTGADGITIQYDGTSGWSALVPDLYPWTEIHFEYDCYTTTEGNGLEVVNTAHTWCTNAELGTDGSENKHATDDGEIYINDPNLVIKKTVTESPIQNDDYQRGEEYRVDDTFTYTVTLVNDVPGTFAKNVRLTDDDMPEGFELVDGPTVNGLEINGEGYKIPYPISGKDDSIHGEEETRTIEYQLTDVQNENGSWGWNLDINYLDYNRPVTVTWTVKATQEMNGYEVYNRAHATADNQPFDEFWSTDTRTGNDYTIVWINTPEFQIDKSVRKTDQTYQVGDVAAYDIELKGLKTPGTLARLTTLDDEFLQEGTTIIEDSFIITDKPTEDEPQDISEQVELNRYVGKQGYHIDMTQVYNDDCGYWVCSDDYRPIYKDGVAGKVDGEHNPVQVKPEYDKEDCESDEVTYGHDYFKVHYEATINEMALQNKIIDNKAVVDSLEGFPAEDNAQVTVIGAQLMINKDSNDGGGFTVGDVAEYEITITNNATGTVAENVQIKDGFTTAKPGTVTIVEGSIKVYDNQNKQLLIAPSQITYTRNESGNIFGFQIDTGYDLPSSQKLTVRYDVKYLANNGGQVITNVAYTWADNAPEVNDPYETWPDDMDQSNLRIDKGSDAQVYEGGSYGTYTLNIVNHSDETALNVVINDDITTDTLGIAQIVQGTIKLYDQLGKAISWDQIEYHFGNGGQIKGFTIYTDYDLDPESSIQVVYQMYFDEVAQDTQVHNEAWTAADNTGKATDDNDVIVYPDGGGDGGTTIPDDPDPDPGEDPKPGDPELAIEKDSNKQWFTPGETGRYELLVTNRAEGTTAENVVIEDGLDAEARELAAIVEGSIVVTDAMGDAVPVQSINYDKDDQGRVYAFTIDTGYDLAYGGALNVSYDVEFDGEVKDTEHVTNLASADSDNTPPAETDHTVNLDPEGKPELTLDKSADKSVVAPGDKLTYKVVVTQPTEGQVAEDTVITDDLPEGFTLDQDSVKVEKDGHAMTCDTEFPAGKLRVSLGDVAYGETWTISYTGTVDKDFLGDELHNVVTGESTNIPEDPTDDTTTPVTNPKLSIEKTADHKGVQPGDELTWEITVTQVNKGAVANNTVVTDELPDGFKADQADVTVTDGQGTDRKANVTIVNGLLTVELGDLVYNDPVIIKVPGTVDEKFGQGELHNVAVADADNVPDPVDDDETVTVGADPVIKIDKRADAQVVEAGDSLLWTIEVEQTEEGAIAKNVIVTDELPRGFTADIEDVSVSDSEGHNWNATVEMRGAKLVVALGDLEYGDPAIIEIDGTVDSDFRGDEILNTAIADADNIDEPVEDDAKVTTKVVPPLDLEKRADTDTVGAGGTVNYTLTTTIGHEDVEDVVITDQLPDGLTAVEDSVHVYLNNELVQFEDTKKAETEEAKDKDADKAAKADESEDKTSTKDTDETADTRTADAKATTDDTSTDTADKSSDEADAEKTSKVENTSTADDNGNAPQFDADGSLTVEMGDLKADDVVRIEYSATADDDVQPGDELVNTAVATGKDVDPVRDEATVNVPSDKTGIPGTNDRGNGVDLSKDLGDQLKNTGDVLAGAYLPAIMGAVAIICLLCLAMYNREHILEALSGIEGPIGAFAAGLLAREAAREEGAVASDEVK